MYLLNIYGKYGRIAIFIYVQISNTKFKQYTFISYFLYSNFLIILIILAYFLNFSNISQRFQSPFNPIINHIIPVQHT